MIRGLAAWTLPKMSNMIYSIVDPGRETISKERGRRMKIFQYFGMEDSIMNHLKLLQATKKKKSNTLLKHGEDLLKKRQFTILCLKQSECLQLPMSAIDRMRRDFMSISKRFFKMQINQFNTIIQYHQFCSINFSKFETQEKPMAAVKHQQYKSDAYVK